MSEVRLLFNGEPLSKFEAQTDLESAAAATEMIGLPGWRSMMFQQCSVEFGRALVFDKGLVVCLETFDR